MIKQLCGLLAIAIMPLAATCSSDKPSTTDTEQEEIVEPGDISDELPGDVIDEIENRKIRFGSPDLRFFELTGHVERVVVHTRSKLNDATDTQTEIIRIDMSGQLQSIVDQSGYNCMEAFERNRDGYIVTIGNDEPNDMDGEVYKQSVEWDKSTIPGYVKSKSMPNPEGDVYEEYVYDDSGKPVKYIAKKKLTATGMNYSGTVKYTYLQFDDSLNWTKRRIEYNLVCRADDNSTLRYTEYEIRDITYFTSLNDARELLRQGRFCESKMCDKNQKAYQLFRKAAEDGNAEACWELGLMCRNGVGTPASTEEAHRYFEWAANRNSAIGKFWLAVSFIEGNGEVPEGETGKSMGDKLFQLAFEQLKEQASSGLGDQYTWTYLGEMYMDGNGTSRNSTYAEQWLKKAAEESLNDRAQYLLGEFYRRSRLASDRNTTDPDEWYLKAAYNGNPEAIDYLKKNGQWK